MHFFLCKWEGIFTNCPFLFILQKVALGGQDNIQHEILQEVGEICKNTFPGMNGRTILITIPYVFCLSETACPTTVSGWWAAFRLVGHKLCRTRLTIPWLYLGPAAFPSRPSLILTDVLYPTSPNSTCSCAHSFDPPFLCCKGKRPRHASDNDLHNSAPRAICGCDSWQFEAQFIILDWWLNK